MFKDLVLQKKNTTKYSVRGQQVTSQLTPTVFFKTDDSSFTANICRVLCGYQIDASISPWMTAVSHFLPAATLLFVTKIFHPIFHLRICQTQCDLEKLSFKHFVIYRLWISAFLSWIAVFLDDLLWPYPDWKQLVETLGWRTFGLRCIFVPGDIVFYYEIFFLGLRVSFIHNFYGKWNFSLSH